MQNVQCILAAPWSTARGTYGAAAHLSGNCLVRPGSLGARHNRSHAKGLVTAFHSVIPRRMPRLFDEKIEADLNDPQTAKKMIVDVAFCKMSGSNCAVEFHFFFSDQAFAN